MCECGGNAVKHVCLDVLGADGTPRTGWFAAIPTKLIVCGGLPNKLRVSCRTPSE